MNYRDLEALLRKDEIKWAENLQTRQQEAETIQEKMRAMIERQKSELDSLMSQCMSVFTPGCPLF